MQKALQDAAADEGEVDCSKERGEMTAIGIDVQKQSMLCRRFLKAAAPTGYVMSSAVLKKFMGAHQVAWEEFEHFFEDLDVSAVVVLSRPPLSLTACIHTWLNRDLGQSLRRRTGAGMPTPTSSSSVSPAFTRKHTPK